MGKIKNQKWLLGLLLILVLLDWRGARTEQPNKLQTPPGNKASVPSSVETLYPGGRKLPERPLRKAPLSYLGITKELVLDSDYNVALIQHPVYPGAGLALIDHQDNFISWLPESSLVTQSPGQLESPGEVLDWWSLESLDGNTRMELAVQYGVAGTALVHPFYLFSYNKGVGFRVLLQLIDASSGTKLVDLDKDGRKEIIHEYSLSGIGKAERDLLRWKDIWRLEDGGYTKISHFFPEEFVDLVRLHSGALTNKEWEDDISSYYPTLLCLQDAGQQLMRGRPVGIEGCQSILNRRS